MAIGGAVYRPPSGIIVRFLALQIDTYMTGLEISGCYRSQNINNQYTLNKSLKKNGCT